jgi:hypothetical protein
MPLTTMSPCRVDAAGLATTTISSCALPWPDAGVSPVIQPASDEAFQAHSGWVETPTVAVAPPELTGEPGGVSVTEHLTGDGPVDVATVDPHPMTALVHTTNPTT